MSTQTTRAIVTLLILTVICQSVQRCRCDRCELHPRHSRNACNCQTTHDKESKQREPAMFNPVSQTVSSQFTHQQHNSCPDSHKSACYRLILAILASPPEADGFATLVNAFGIPPDLHLQTLDSDQHCRLAMSGLLHDVETSPLRSCLRLQI